MPVERPSVTSERGIAMVALLVSMAVMAVVLSVALPSWKTLTQRDREEELIFRGTQYARAITLYQRKFANGFPPTVDFLVEQKFLRRKYKDPMTKDGEFQLLVVGQEAGQAGQGSQPGQGGGVLGQQGRGGAQGSAPGGGVGAAGGGIAGGGLGGGGLAGATPAGGGARGGILGVVSKSQDASLRLYNGRGKYNEWTFVGTVASTRAGAPAGSQNPTGGVGGLGGARGDSGQQGPRGGGFGFPGGRDGRGGPGQDGPGGRGQNGPRRGNQPFGPQPGTPGGGGGFGGGFNGRGGAGR